MAINIEYFKENQILDNRSVGSGIYIIELLKSNSKEAIPLYIGQSLYMVKRGGEHLYDFFNEPCYLGLSEENMADSNLTIRFRVLENCFPHARLKREINYIKKIKPILQNRTNDNMIDVESKKNNVKEALKKIGEYFNVGTDKLLPKEAEWECEFCGEKHKINELEHDRLQCYIECNKCNRTNDLWALFDYI